MGETIFFAFAVVVFVFVLLITSLIMYGGSRMTSLTDIPPAAGDDLPQVSIVVAARNEERDVELGVRSLLALDYPRLEIIAVNDRSTDGTGAILDRIAAEDARLRPVHVTELPAGWLGKNHAMHLGAEQAAGELILFTDADVVFDPTCLRRAVAFLTSTGIDHLSLFPECRMPNWLLEAFVVVFGIAFMGHLRPWQVKDPNSTAFCGVGAFNLVRRAAYRQMGGHEPVRMRPDDDIMLGKLVKREGFRSDVLFGSGMMWVPWYATFWELVVGLEKNMFAGFEYSIPYLLTANAIALTLNVGPFVGIWFATGWTLGLLAAACGMLLTNFILSAHFGGYRWWLFPLYPFIWILFSYIQFRAMFLTLANDGIRWRDTHYSLAELRANKV